MDKVEMFERALAFGWLFFEGCENALVGYTVDLQPVYSHAKLLEVWIEKLKCEYHEAIDYVDQVFLGVHYEKKPIIIFDDL